MPALTVRLHFVVQTLDDETVLGEALFFPDFSCYAESPDRLESDLRLNAARSLEAAPLHDFPIFQLTATPAVSEVRINVPPPPRADGTVPPSAWTRPIELRFDVLRWQHLDEAHLAFVPALGIEIVARRGEDLDALIPEHIRAALQRAKALHSLPRLLTLQRATGVRVIDAEVDVAIRSPKQIAISNDGAAEDEKQFLKEVVDEITATPIAPAYEVEENVTRMAEVLVRPRPASVLLVGKPGVGKTAAFHEFVRRRAEFGLGHTPFWATSGARLIAGMAGFGMWEERCTKLLRVAAKRRAILAFGNLVELVDAGKHESSSVGVAAFLRPYLARGEILAVCECSAEQRALLEREDPHILDAFQTIEIDEPAPETARRILAHVARDLEAALHIPVADEALADIERLHRRYATYSAFPGRPLRFLTNLLKDAAEKRDPHADAAPVSASNAIRAFSRETGLPPFMLDDAIPLDLDAARRWFTERVIGQSEAVERVVDIIATAKAGLVRPRRPIMSLLFIGPTGVGKTELAKALAQFLFSDKNRLTRFDMSEFGDPLAVRRLVAGEGDGSGLLTSKVRETPFAVLLFDEFEKAHPLFFDLLLQVLGEGRLTDAAGRVADFCNTVIVMTSNLGAQSFQQGRAGLRSSAGADAYEHFFNEVRAFLRPEIFNRIDRLVPFAPLDAEIIERIARREVDLLRSRDGILLRRVELSIAPEVVRHLAATGYDARYGARPLKRAIERQLLAPLAAAFNQYPAEWPLEASAALDQNSVRVAVRPTVDANGAPGWLRSVRTEGAAESAAGITALRRMQQNLERSGRWRELKTDLVRAHELAKKFEEKTFIPPEVRRQLERIPTMEMLIDDFDTLFASVRQGEESALLGLFGEDGAPADESAQSQSLKDLSALWTTFLRDLYAFSIPNSSRATLAVYGESSELQYTLANAYIAAAREAGCSATVRKIVVRDRDADDPEVLAGRATARDKAPGDVPINSDAVASFFAAPSSAVLGIIVAIHGPLALPRFEAERGVHLFKWRNSETQCLVNAIETSGRYNAPTGLERRQNFAHQETRRVYDVIKGSAEDALSKRTLPLDMEHLHAVIVRATGEHLQRQIEAQAEDA